MTQTTSQASKMNRRAFLVSSAVAGGGLALGFDLPRDAEAASKAATNAAPEVTAWVVIKPDNSVIIRIARSEMGQGTSTGLAQMLAEELECDWSKVSMEFPTPGENVKRGKPWGRMFTAGSRGIRESNELVRKGGATARMMLVQAAATEWKVPVAECTAANGMVSHKSGKKLSYGKLAAAAGKLEPPKDVPLKDPKDWKIIGKGVKRLDTAPKVTGAHVYTADLKLPGMLLASIRSVPVFGGKVKSFDAAKVSGMPGVKKVVQVGDGAVAVIADHWWEANEAVKKLPIEWDVDPKNAQVSSATIAELFKGGLDADEAFVGNANGDAKAAIA
ncbi:MAG: xanthine dehydrogenase family protein molybdopterin-binding subunit, partial [Alphaproteobacteria bacterium]|nr:xanthine dehydrogenase family protein molybdopterin-binding subunit [Alphaproteobacteria bacterium]